VDVLNRAVVVSGANQPEVAVAPQSARPSPKIAIAALVLLAAPVPGAAGGGEGPQDVRRRLTQCRAPVIVTQPADVTIPSGEAATLTVVATGLAPLAFQWYRGESGDTSAPVGTDSPSFTTPPFGATASYWVRVSNACGQASSRAALVTVSGLPNQEITVYLGAGNTVPLVLIRIPKGTFMMGSPAGERGREADEGPQHRVTLTQDYYIGKYEVTQRQWLAVTGSNPPHLTPCGPDCPVERISWNEVCGGTTGTSCAASSFIGKLNQLLGTTLFRLPTEAEWEWAARGGTSTRYSFGDALECGDACESCATLEQYMWWCGNALATKPVGQKQPNQYGLYDVHGGVWEWVGDRYGTYAPGDVTDPTGPATGSGRVSRGGAWHIYARSGRSANRFDGDPRAGQQDTLYGFRVARSQ
jgi:formylglycine-generating enzyme required for sulfatase activity